jgi:hypothetical protein
MKKMLLLTLSISVATAVSASAGTCVSDPLSIYDASGFSCTLGTLTFSDFTYAQNGFGGASVPPDSSVDVATVTSGFGSDTGLEFSADWTVTPGELEHPTISFDVSTANPPGLTDMYLQAVGGFAGNGSASVTEDTITPSESLFTAFAAGTDIPNDSVSFPPVGSLSINGEISLVGGSGMAGSNISNVYSLFSEGTAMTPEPSLTLLCLCALGIVPLARRKFVR